MTTASMDNPVASGSEQFGLARSRHDPPCQDSPSLVGIRPWGLRGMRRGAVAGRTVPEFVYSHELQLAVSNDRTPLILTGMAGPERRFGDRW